MGLAVGRWRFQLGGTDAWTRAPSRTGPGGIDANLFDFRLDAGYDFLRWRGLTGFALVGIAGSTFTMDARARNWDYLGSSAAVLGNPDSIERDAGLLTLQAGFEEILTFNGSAPALIVSLRGGYTQQLGLSSWSSSGSHTVSGTTDVNFSGTWLSLGLGFGLF